MEDLGRQILATKALHAQGRLHADKLAKMRLSVGQLNVKVEAKTIEVQQFQVLVDEITQQQGQGLDLSIQECGKLKRFSATSYLFHEVGDDQLAKVVLNWGIFARHEKVNLDLELSWWDVRAQASIPVNKFDNFW